MKRTDQIYLDTKSSSTESTRLPWVAIMGNPNAGKTALFNRLTGMHHKVSNYPGVTVERRRGWLKGGSILVEDFPGTYSFKAESEDERIVADQIQSWRDPVNRPDVVIVVIDATNISRSIYFATQILEWGIPTILALNMADEVRRSGRTLVNTELLKTRLQADSVIYTSAKTGEGLAEIVQSIRSICARGERGHDHPPILMRINEKTAILHDLVDQLHDFQHLLNFSPLVDAIRLISDDAFFDQIGSRIPEGERDRLAGLIKSTRQALRLHGQNPAELESTLRFTFIDQDLQDAIIPDEPTESASEKADKILTHPVSGIMILISVMAVIFSAVFQLAEYPMDMIENSVLGFSQTVQAALPPSEIRSLIVDGVIGGVGNVIVFLPQIILLIFFLGILEDTGYMSRMSFMLDKLMRKIGLSGRSVLPLMSGFACAIPAIMAARTVENRFDRLKLIMLIPLMSCSARLPVYTLLISAFIPAYTIWGVLNIQGLVLLGIYFLGFFTAIFASWLMKKIAKKERTSTFIMELPPYRLPILRSLFWRIADSSRLFLVNAGSIILAMSIVLWFMASYPGSGTQDPAQDRPDIESSYAGKLGHAIEPLIEPLGFDWKIGIGLITSFAAREVIISTFATIYNVDAPDDQAVVPLRTAMRGDRRPSGERVFSTAVALSLLVFFVYAAQCMSTFAVIRRETGTWRWPLVMIVYMNVLAYMGALMTYQTATLLGLG